MGLWCHMNHLLGDKGFIMVEGINRTIVGVERN